MAAKASSELRIKEVEAKRRKRSSFEYPRLDSMKTGYVKQSRVEDGPIYYISGLMGMASARLQVVTLQGILLLCIRTKMRNASL